MAHSHNTLLYSITLGKKSVTEQYMIYDFRNTYFYINYKKYSKRQNASMLLDEQ